MANMNACSASYHAQSCQTVSSADLANDGMYMDRTIRYRPVGRGTEHSVHDGRKSEGNDHDDTRTAACSQWPHGECMV